MNDSGPSSDITIEYGGTGSSGGPPSPPPPAVSSGGESLSRATIEGSKGIEAAIRELGKGGGGGSRKPPAPPSFAPYPGDMGDFEEAGIRVTATGFRDTKTGKFLPRKTAFTRAGDIAEETEDRNRFIKLTRGINARELAREHLLDRGYFPEEIDKYEEWADEKEREGLRSGTIAARKAKIADAKAGASRKGKATGRVNRYYAGRIPAAISQMIPQGGFGSNVGYGAGGVLGSIAGLGPGGVALAAATGAAGAAVVGYDVFPRVQGFFARREAGREAFIQGERLQGQAELASGINRQSMLGMGANLIGQGWNLQAFNNMFNTTLGQSSPPESFLRSKGMPSEEDYSNLKNFAPSIELMKTRLRYQTLLNRRKKEVEEAGGENVPEESFPDLDEKIFDPVEVSRYGTLSLLPASLRKRGINPRARRKLADKFRGYSKEDKDTGYIDVNENARDLRRTNTPEDSDFADAGYQQPFERRMPEVRPLDNWINGEDIIKEKIEDAISPDVIRFGFATSHFGGMTT